MKRYMIMKKIALLLCLSALTAVTVSCNNNDKPEPNQSAGQVKVGLKPTGEFVVVTGKADAAPSLDKFSLKIINKADGKPFSEYSSYADVPDILTIPAGDYTIVSCNGVEKPADFDSPFYYGQTDFKVEISKLTEVEVVCQLKNVKVTVGYTDAFKAGVKDASVTVDNRHASQEGFLPYAIDEQRAGYFSVPADGKLEVIARGIRVSDGGVVNKAFYITNVQSRQWHKITIDFTTSGSTDQSITIDVTTDDKDVDVVIPDDDEIINGGGNNGNWEDDPTNPDPDPDPNPDPDPIQTITMTGKGFSIDNPLVLTDAQVEGEVEVDVDLAVTDGIAQLWVTIDSPTLTPEVLASIGIPQTFDMANLESNPDLAAALRLVGLIGDEPLRGMTSYKFSVGAFMSMFQSPMDHAFTIRIVDSKGIELQKQLLIRRTVQ